ncbi:leukocyte elastase inhibitor [Callorhinchus milii]|uniref:leukocyte elastase inhibitor n=1 Tax=Callorhinchus milii TaxID=7868 RepID=UPI001C3FBCA6|nr:leukocyte elastase inhibitor [Callorhinchus milii]XP_007887816.2 leukocyte elastase inhibitor [Callorhinchus milii]
MDPLKAAITNFSLDLFKHLNKADKTGNIFVSPFSISTALAMLLLGAEGNTAAQMVKVLHFNKVKDIHSEFQALQSDIVKFSAPCHVKLANRLYGEENITLHSKYLESTLKFYQAEFGVVDFPDRAEEARSQINSWVEEQTEGKIPNLLAQGMIDQFTKLVLVNAIYFKGRWTKSFDKEDTEERLFFISKDDSKTVNMMSLKGTFNVAYVEELETQILEIPYAENKLSMFILLPDSINDNSTGLEKLEKSLTFDKLLKWTSAESLSSSTVNVYLPRFKLEESYDLQATLSSMGMSDVFDGAKADFSRMTGERGLSLTKIVHKSFIEVTEEGTEAAASTGAVLMFRCLNSDEFVADHPFLFFIRESKTQNILFFGRFSIP